MSWGPERPEWEPLQTGLESSTVKLVETPLPDIRSMDDAVKGPLRADLASHSAAENARLHILGNADRHITNAVTELVKAVAWFSVVDRGDHADLVRQVEGLADTIAYRLRNAGG